MPWLPGGLPAVVALLAATALFPGIARPDQARFLVGESIHVGPAESLERAICIACSIHVEGEVEANTVLLLGTLVNSGTIEGDVVVMGGSLESTGRLNGNSVVLAGSMTLRGDVSQDAIAILGSIHVPDPSVRIGGDSVTVLGQQTGVSPESVAGTVREIGSVQLGRTLLSGTLAVTAILAVALIGVLLALNSAAYLALGGNRLEVIAATYRRNSPLCFLVGLATWFALGGVGLVLAMLLPVSIPMLILLLIIAVVGYCGMTYGIGRDLLPSMNPFVATQLSALVVLMIELLPLAGLLVTFVLCNVAMGAAVTSGFGTDADWLASRSRAPTLDRRQTA